MQTFLKNWTTAQLATLPDEMPPFVAEATAQVLEHLQEAGFHTPQLAAALSLSREQLWRKLEKTASLPPHAFIRDWRLRAAHALLLAFPTQRVWAVGQCAGFENPEHFAKAFKDMFGESPRKYRTNFLAKEQDATK